MFATLEGEHENLRARHCAVDGGEIRLRGDPTPGYQCQNCKNRRRGRGGAEGVKDGDEVATRPDGERPTGHGRDSADGVRAGRQGVQKSADHTPGSGPD